MVRTERRQVPRMTVRGPAYVNLDPNNGGAILNISEGGLCFQSTAAIQPTETIRFWFSYWSPRIEADAGPASKDEAETSRVSRFIEVGIEMAWTDQTRKMGGLRFTNLPAEAREQIRDWIRRASLVAMNEKAALSPPESRFFAVKQSVTNAARRASARLKVRFRQIRSGRLWTGFSGGLLVGLLVAALAVALFSLLTRSRELGDSLIRVGERLGGKSWSQAVSPQPQATSPAPRSTSPDQVTPASGNGSSALPPAVSESLHLSAEPQTREAASIQAPSPQKLASTKMPTTTESDEVKPEAASLATPSLSAPSVKPSDTPALTSTAGRPMPPGSGIAPASDPSASLPRPAAPEVEFVNRPGVHGEPGIVEGKEIRSERFLEVGSFKEKLLAEKTADKFSQLGFPATITQRNRFWGKSYQVLVGPYGGDRDAEAAHKDLVSLGFIPRSYERGRRDFMLPPALKVANTRLPVGDCVISWESYTPDAIVKIEDDRGIGVTLGGKWVKHGVRYTVDAVEYQKNRDGSGTLIEFRFAGMERALVFANN
jgi:cell division protein FtsN